MSQNTPHIPVLLNEVISNFKGIEPFKVLIDCTLGYGGHSEAILKRYENIKVVGIDRDPEAIKFCKKSLDGFKDRLELVEGPFSKVVPDILNKYEVAGVLADLGVSSLQIDKKERGFSFHSQALDMRMDSKSPLTAYDVVNKYPLNELERIFRDYAEHRAYKKIAKAIVEARAIKPIESGIELADIFAKVLKKISKINPATTLFQAIRIEVNDELSEIESLLDSLQGSIPYGAIIQFITFHSLEDRLIKRRFRKWSLSCVCPSTIFRCECGADNALGEVVTKKPIVAKRSEVRLNPRSRSAKLRVFRFKKVK